MKTLVANGKTEAEAQAQIDKAKVEANKEAFAELGKNVNENKPDERYTNVIKYVEGKYSCSGMCSTPLFYFTQSVEKGIPKEGCVKPFIEDVSKIFFELGVTIVLSGILFILMFLFVCPLCCLTEKEERPSPQQLEMAQH